MSLILLGRARAASAGMNVIDRISEPASANSTVRAIGRNSFPSTPSRVRMGR